MGFTKGTSAAETLIKQEEAARAASRDPSRVDFWSLAKDDDSCFLRFLTEADEIITVKQHTGVLTKAAPEGVAKWPKAMGAVCRRDPQLDFEDCYICDNKLKNSYGNDSWPANRSWALAVLRTAQGDDVIDVMEEYEILDADGKPTGKKGNRPTIVVVNQSWKLFFSAIHHQYIAQPMAAKRTIRNRDFYIRRSNTGKDTTYGITAMDATPELAPGTEAWKVYEDVLAERGVDLEKIVIGQADDLYYARWFDVTKAVDKEGKITSTGATISESSAAVYSGELDQQAAMSPAMAEKLARLQNRQP